VPATTNLTNRWSPFYTCPRWIRTWAHQVYLSTASHLASTSKRFRSLCTQISSCWSCCAL